MTADLTVDDLPRRPLYRSEYELLQLQGAFLDQRVELLQGQIVYASEEGPPHATLCVRLNRILIEGIPANQGEVRVGNPFALSELSEPEPDFFVTQPCDSYRAAHPATARLLIEVAESSRGRDLGLKAALYAAAGIPDYWVVDITREVVIVHREPANLTFGAITIHGPEAIVHPLYYPALGVDVGALLR